MQTALPSSKDKGLDKRFDEGLDDRLDEGSDKKSDEEPSITCRHDKHRVDKLKCYCYFEVEKTKVASELAKPVANNLFVKAVVSPEANVSIPTPTTTETTLVQHSNKTEQPPVVDQPFIVPKYFFFLKLT